MTAETEERTRDDADDPRAQLPAENMAKLRGALQGLAGEIRMQQRRALKPRREAAPGRDSKKLFDELRRRIGTLGMTERDPSVDDFGMQTDFVDRLLPLLDFLYERYWRVQLLGEEALPTQGPVLFVANRAGIVPWDGMMLSHSVDRSSSGIARPRFLVEDEVLRVPFAQAQLARVGGVRACAQNFEDLTDCGHSVIGFPEGARGVLHSFRDRYQVGRFERGEVVEAALRRKIPIVPVGIVGAEEAVPRLGDTRTLSKLASRDLGLPILPITPTFPLLGPLGLLPLPSRWVIHFGQPVVGGDPPRVLDALRVELQYLVERGLDARTSIWL